jgi:peptidyl-prolyl cis-trans isomerase A (cyclophilin A)
MLWRRYLRILAVAAASTTAMAATPAQALVARFVTTLGNFDLRLFHTRTPLTVQNFQQYVSSNRWDGTFIHRAPDLNVGTPQNPIMEPFVVQGGGYKLGPAPQGIFGTTSITRFPAVQNEPGLTNARGTISMAKSEGNPNSATSEWFINTRNNAGPPPALDSQNGGFTVFGRVLGNGMSVLDAIQNLEWVNAAGFQNVPVLDFDKVVAQQNVFTEDAVILTDVRLLNIPDGDYDLNGVVNNGDLGVWRNQFGSTILADADGDGNGVVDGRDFLVWQRTRLQNFGPPTAGAIPEPGAASLALSAFTAFAARQRRRRRA